MRPPNKERRDASLEARPVSLSTISIIVPVYNGGEMFVECVRALQAIEPAPLEILVVDDGSRDDTLRHARHAKVCVLHTPKPQSGPAVARNLGAEKARGEILFFVDADVAVPPDICARLTNAFADADIAALFGSYDDAPAGTAFASQYKNLLHHYTHQHSRVESNSFWAGCGAMRADIFRALGGFKTSFTRPCIEDIELGYRVTRAGHKIHLRKEVQVKHLKNWSLRTMLYTDIFDRALPWTRLLKYEHDIPRDLNLQTAHRVSAGLTWLLLGACIGALFWSWLWFAVSAIVLVLLALNVDLYRFFWRERGVWFALRAIPLHWLYYLYSSTAFAYVWFLEPAIAPQENQAPR